VDDLTQRLAALTERVDALTRRVDDLARRVDGLAERVDDLTQRLAALTERVDALTRRVDDLTVQMQALVGRVGEMDGDLMELRFARRAPAYLGRFARRIRVIEPAQLADLLDDAVEVGRLTERERESAMLADVVAQGRRRSDGAETYFVAEVSAGIGVGDVRRALERARVLAKLGEPVVPVVVGRRINGDAQQYARSSGVEHVLVPARTGLPEGEPPSSQ
jgi:polyhydroxyalkanoate synthesis regulator phasin